MRILLSCFKSRQHVSSRKTNTLSPGYEEPPAENYYARDYQDDYSPSPPHASGGSYYPQNNAFPPPPQPQPGFTQHTTTSTTHVNHDGIPPYNPADYANPPPHPDPYGYPPQPRAADNVSANDHTSHRAFVPSPVPTGVSGAPPYFPPPPVAPLPEEHFDRDPFERTEEGASDLFSLSFQSSRLSRTLTFDSSRCKPSRSSIPISSINHLSTLDSSSFPILQAP